MVKDFRKGAALAVLSYCIWGALPLFWKMLPAAARLYQEENYAGCKTEFRENEQDGFKIGWIALYQFCKAIPGFYREG
jgi:hypothetical protein